MSEVTNSSGAKCSGRRGRSYGKESCRGDRHHHHDLRQGGGAIRFEEEVTRLEIESIQFPPGQCYRLLHRQIGWKRTLVTGAMLVGWLASPLHFADRKSRSVPPRATRTARRELGPESHSPLRQQQSPLSRDSILVHSDDSSVRCHPKSNGGNPT